MVCGTVGFQIVHFRMAARAAVRLAAPTMAGEKKKNKEKEKNNDKDKEKDKWRDKEKKKDKLAHGAEFPNLYIRPLVGGR